MNLTLASPTSLVMGDGVLLRRNAMQLLRTAYNLSQQYRIAEWAGVWTKITANPCVQVKCPVMTRWECVGCTVLHVLEHKNDWKKVAETIVQIETTGTAKHTLASYLCSYLDAPMIIAHLHFLKAYLLTWWDQHST